MRERALALRHRGRGSRVWRSTTRRGNGSSHALRASARRRRARGSASRSRRSVREVEDPVRRPRTRRRCPRIRRRCSSRRGVRRDVVGIVRVRERLADDHRDHPCAADARTSTSNGTSRRHGMRSSPRRASTVTLFFMTLRVGDDDRLVGVRRDRHVAPADADDLPDHLVDAHPVADAAGLLELQRDAAPQVAERLLRENASAPVMTADVVMSVPRG